MLTQRDIEIIKFANIFGKTFVDVLGQTYFADVQQARNRVNKLVKQGVFYYKNTGLAKPRNALVLTAETQKYLEKELGMVPRQVKLSVSTLQHTIHEQLAYYWLSQIGEVERTTVYTHGKKLHHVPDIILHTQGYQLYIEIEMQKKSQKRYAQIIADMQKDPAAGVIYISPTLEKSKALESFLPRWEKLRFIAIYELIENIKITGKIGARSQDAGLFEA